jgi:rhodanese-related sulfurtransferase
MTDIKRVSPQEALDLTQQGWTYVDVRSEPEFEAGRPAGSFNVPVSHMAAGGMTPNADFVAVMERAFGKDAKIVVGCKAGGRSMRAAQMLVAAGFTNVIDQRAGWDGARDAFGRMGEAGWSPAGLPSEKGASVDHDYAGIKAKASK